MFHSPDPRLTPSTDEDLQPDPLFMVLRRTCDWFTTRFDAWRDAREDRREAAAAVAQANTIVREAAPLTSFAARSDRDDLAA